MTDFFKHTQSQSEFLSVLPGILGKAEKSLAKDI